MESNDWHTITIMNENEYKINTLFNKLILANMQQKSNENMGNVWKNILFKEKEGHMSLRLEHFKRKRK